VERQKTAAAGSHLLRPLPATANPKPDPAMKLIIRPQLSRPLIDSEHSSEQPPVNAPIQTMNATSTTSTAQQIDQLLGSSHTTTTANPSRGMVQNWDQHKETRQNETVDFTSLDACRIRDTDPPERPQPQLTLNGHQISTSGNLTVITAQAKAGKTGVVTGILGAFLAQMGETLVCTPGVGIDCLGFIAQPHEGRAVILFDTEQSKYDAYQLVQRGLRRSNTQALPGNFRCYSLIDTSCEQRRQFLAAEMQRARQECGGIHAVIVDGVADLCVDPNNTEESFGLVEELMQLASKHDCPLILVLHENPSGTGQGYSKGRGHLGSQLERKAESNLRVEKNAGGVSVIYSERCRKASIPKSQGIRFQWCDEKSMHVTVHGTEGESRAVEKREDTRAQATEVYEGVTGPLKWGELKKRMMERLSLTSKTTERRIKEWQQLGVLAKEDGGYVFK
jgi:hypothetical protein